jgi:hypothetical protein
MNDQTRMVCNVRVELFYRPETDDDKTGKEGTFPFAKAVEVMTKVAKAYIGGTVDVEGLYAFKNSLMLAEGYPLRILPVVPMKRPVAERGDIVVKRPAVACADDVVGESPCKPARAKATPEKNSDGVDDVRSLDDPARAQGKRISIKQAAVGSVGDKTPERRQRGSGRLDISLVRLPNPFD